MMLRKIKLSNPDARRTPGYFWTLTEKIEIPELHEQLENMRRHGAMSLCLHPLPPEFRADVRSNMSPPYLSEPYNALIGELADICSELGMKFFLYDEGGWPSGSACGQVVRSDPERFTPKFAVSDGNGGYKITQNIVNPGGAAQMPNLLAPGATEKFIELTHEALKRHLGKHFGKTVHIAFTDEPTMPGSTMQKLAWVDDLPAEFIKRKNYDLIPFLGKLLDPDTYPGTDMRRSRLAEVYTDYCDVMSQLFVERFLQPLRRWCRDNKLLSGGHFGGEDTWLNCARNGFGHILRSLRALDCPGVDVIWRQLFREERLHPFPKLASSAAHLNGNRDVLAEMFAIYGSGLTPVDMKFLLDYMLVCGVNTFVFSNMPAQLRAGSLNGGRPCFGDADPMWKYFNEVHHYAGTMAGLTSMGKPGANIALFFDMRQLWQTSAHEKEYSAYEQIFAADRLRRTQRDFDYISDDEVCAGRLRKGKFVTGKMCFDAIVMPPLCSLSAAVKGKLDDLRRAGFPVLSVSEAVNQLPPVLEVASPYSWDILVMKRILPRGEALYMVMNSADKTVRADFAAAEKLPVAVADIREQNFYEVGKNGAWQWTFAPYEARCFILGEVESVPLPEPAVTVVKELKKWLFAPVERRYADSPYREVISAEPVAAKLGDWKALLGKDFSGTAVYSTTFRAKTPDDFSTLDLGVVKYACEVSLNGKSLGKRFFPPYTFDLRSKVRRGVNKLQISVTNTLANAITGEVEARWQRDFAPLSPYHTLEREFEKESVDSGLFGPVTLKI